MTDLEKLKKILKDFKLDYYISDGEQYNCVYSDDRKHHQWADFYFCFDKDGRFRAY